MRRSDVAGRKRKPKTEDVAVPPPPLPPPLTPSPTTRFERDVVRMGKQGRDMERFRAVVEALCSRQPLASELRDHGLSGEWRGCRDCHVAPDWIIIYERGGEPT